MGDLVKNGAPPGKGQIQPRPCSGDAHIAQPAFLLQPLFILRGAHGGENAFFHAGHEHAVILQALCAVQRHHGHILRRVFLLVQVCYQGHILQESFQGLVLALGFKFLSRAGKFH